MVDEYVATSSDLSTVATRTGEEGLVVELSVLVGAAGDVVHGATSRDRAAISHAVTRTFPSAVWQLRRAILVATVLLYLPAVVAGAWVASSSDVRAALGPPEALDAYVGEAFEDYYTDQPNAVFAAAVGTNNATVGATAFGLGILAGVPTALVLAFNGVNVGVAGGLFFAIGDPTVFFSSILPHGLLELTAVTVAGGAGLHLGWSLLVPGDRPRGRALATEGRRAAVVALGLVPTFAVAALLEGFVTPRDWPAVIEVGIGALVLGVFVALVWQGRHGDVVEADRSDAATGRQPEVAVHERQR